MSFNMPDPPAGMRWKGSLDMDRDYLVKLQKPVLGGLFWYTVDRKYVFKFERREQGTERAILRVAQEILRNNPLVAEGNYGGVYYGSSE